MIWERDKVGVWATLGRDGALTISGQDLSSGLYSLAEYEYALTVKAADVDQVVSALGGAPGADVLALLHANAETILRVGEKRWLEEHYIPATFWSRIEP